MPFLQNVSGVCSCRSLQLYEHKDFNAGVFLWTFLNFSERILMSCESFLKVHKNTGKKIFAKYLSADGCFIKTNTINCDDNNNTYLFPSTGAFAFTRQPMKRNLIWSTREIHLRSSMAFLYRLKLWFAKNWRWTCVLPRQMQAFANIETMQKFSLFAEGGAIV